jgi:hypothetical protein
MTEYLTSNLSRRRRDGQPAVTWPVGAVPPQRRARPMAAAYLGRPLPALQSTKHDEVFTYSIGAMQGTHLAHLGLTVGDSGGSRWWPLFLEVG